MIQRLRIELAALAAVALTLFALMAWLPATPSVRPITAQMVGVQLNMWSFDSVAAECPTLHQDGYDWVLVSPPEEDIQGLQWWTHYQPVSYQINSSLGNSQSFTDMVHSCAAAGVQIVADVVLNHMTGKQSGTGFAGTDYSKYNYPGLWQPSDFHNCPTGSIQDWTNVTEIQQCELLGLADLNTSLPGVQNKLAGYLHELRDIGVAGFRIDAAKHIAASELKQIVRGLDANTTLISEVVGETPPQSDYYAFTDVFSFSWVNQVSALFSSSASLSGAADQSFWNTLSPSSKTVTLVSNHDTERNGDALTYKSPEKFNLASLYTLAVPYGLPMMYSSYAFSDNDSGPAVDANGYQLPVHCANQGSTYKSGDWVCQHRWRDIVAMIGFHKTVGNSALANLWRSANGVAFSRNGLGFAAFNTGDQPLSKTLQTGLPSGTYRDRISGRVVIVGADGAATIDVPAWSALAIDVNSKR